MIIFLWEINSKLLLLIWNGDIFLFWLAFPLQRIIKQGIISNTALSKHRIISRENKIQENVLKHVTHESEI